MAHIHSGATDSVGAIIARLVAIGAVPTMLKPGVKHPSRCGFFDSPPPTHAETLAYVAGGGNVGIEMARSGLVCIDAETDAGTVAMCTLGYAPWSYPAKSQLGDTLPDGSPNLKHGGAHFVFRVPDGIDSASLPVDRCGYRVTGGGEFDKFDVLAGRRYIVVPPSRLDEAGGAAYAAGEAFSTDIPVAPEWLFNRGVDAPAALAAAHGAMIPDPPRVRVERDARSAELSDEIDSVGWDEWLAGDPRLMITSQRDTCGCQIWYWFGASNEKSVTLHDRCAAMGNGAHIWSGTMRRDLDIDALHLSRLNFAVALRGGGGLAEDEMKVLRREVAAVVGIRLGGGLTNDHLDLEPLTVLVREPVAPRAGVVGDVVAGAINPTPGVLPMADRPPVAGTAALAAVPRIGTVGPAPAGEAAAPVRHLTVVPPVFGTVGGGGAVPAPEAAGIPASIRAYMEHDAVWELTPALRRIAADADRNGVSRWAQLGAALARVSAATPPRVQLVGATGEPGSAGAANLDIFVVESGPGGSGKSLVIKAGAAYVPAEFHGFAVHATATGEGLNKGLREQQFNGDEPTERRWYAATLLEEAEGENFTRMTLAREATLLPQLRLHWGGDQAGKMTSDKQRRTMMDALWARVSVLLVLHPEACAMLLEQVGNGSAARFVWLPAYRTGAPVSDGGRERPFVLPDYRVSTSGQPGCFPPIGTVGGDTPQPDVFWIRRPQAMQADMDRNGVRTFVDPVAVTETDDAQARRMHDLLQRFKISAVLAAMDGIAQPGDDHWHAACEILEVSHLVQAGLGQAVARIREIAAEGRGRDLAVTDVTRTGARDEITIDDAEQARIEILDALAAGPLRRSGLRTRCGRRGRRGFTAGLRCLVEQGLVTDGDAVALTPAGAALLSTA